MQQWAKDHITLAAALLSVSAYAFTTFATKTYVAELEANREARTQRIVTFIKEGNDKTDAKIERLNDKIDRLLVRK